MSQITWEITIANTLSVEQSGQMNGEWYETNHAEVELDFYPEVGVETRGNFQEGDDPETGDTELDKVLNSVVDDLF